MKTTRASVREWLVAHRLEMLACLGLAAAVGLVYQPAWHGGLLWDDDTSITRPGLRSLTGLWKIWSDPSATFQYYPLTHSLLWVEHRLWGDTTLGYHLVNIALHACSAVLVATILRKLRIPGAYLAAAIFALHPVNVESVAWITEFKNALSSVFYLAAFRVYLTFDERRRPWPYVLALALFTLALLSKTVTVTLPAALLVVFWWQRGRLRWREDVVPLLPFFAMALASGYLTSWVERHLMGAEGASFDLTLVERAVLASRIVWFYLAKLLWPEQLTFVYARWDLHPLAWWQWVYPAGLVALVGACWAVRRRSRAPLAAVLFFIGTLAPMLGFFNVYYFVFSYVADHFQYTASLGVITLVSAGLARALERRRVWGEPLGNAACGALLVALAIATWRQARLYADPELLYRDTIAKNPAASMAHQNLGVILAHEGRPQEAIGEFQDAIRIRPDFQEAHTSLGAALAGQGRVPEAIAELRAALRINPDYAAALNDLGVVLAGEDSTQEAIEAYRHALRALPDYPDAFDNLGDALMVSGQTNEAIAAYDSALRLIPNSVDATYKLGVAFLHAGNNPEAIEHLQAALRLTPAFPEAHNNLGVALVRSGRIPEAVEQFEQAVRLRPDYAQARNNLAAARQMGGGE